jgi:anti-anti-sigma factor
MEEKALITITKQTIDDATMYVVHLRGDIDAYNISEIEPEIHRVIAEHNSKLHLILDLHDTQYINSKFVGFVINWFLTIQENNGRLALVGAKDHIKDVLSVQGVLDLIPHFDSIEEALL